MQLAHAGNSRRPALRTTGPRWARVPVAGSQGKDWRLRVEGGREGVRSGDPGSRGRRSGTGMQLAHAGIRCQRKGGMALACCRLPASPRQYSSVLASTHQHSLPWGPVWGKPFPESFGVVVVGVVVAAVVVVVLGVVLLVVVVVVVVVAVVVVVVVIVIVVAVVVVLVVVPGFRDSIRSLAAPSKNFGCPSEYASPHMNSTLRLRRCSRSPTHAEQS